MIELRHDSLRFSFPEVHEDARFSIDFQRTLRIPDDGSDYPLPAGLGRFPLRHVDDFGARVPQRWSARGGVLMPMYQAEALWLNFNDRGYPFALKIAAGKINAVTGKAWTTALQHGPSPSLSRGDREGPVQDYVVVGDQPWLDGFNVGEGRIRQFVAMPLGEGYTAEEQLTGRADTGGLQLLAYPMKAEKYEEIRRRAEERRRRVAGLALAMAAPPDDEWEMGLGAGGRMRQDISRSPYSADVWDLEHASRCFVHIANSRQWATITGEAPPMPPPGPEDYARARIPWFTYYSAGDIVAGSPELAALASVAEVARDKGDLLPDNDPIPIDRVVDLTPRPRPEPRVRVDEGPQDW